MAPENVLAFYAQSHWGSRYGVVDAFHDHPHKGLDVALFHGIVDVPALHSGIVVAVGASPAVGHYVTVQTEDGLFDTYCHIVLGVSVGQAVDQGTRLGRQAVTQEEGGAEWRGQHTHLCRSRTPGGWGVWGYVNLDPTPGVIAVLTSTAGGGSTPLPSNPTARPKGTHTMSQVIYLPKFPAMVDADPRIAKLKGYVGGAGLSSFTPNAGIYALVGDSPGTRANVQVSQSDARLNEWVADHTGSLPAPYNVSQAARPYINLDEFLALCDAYLALV